MLEKTYLIVKETDDEHHLPDKVVDMSIIIQDVSLDDLAKAVNLEHEKLKKQYPIGQYTINQSHSNVFPAPEYLAERKLSEVRELEASKILSTLSNKKK